ACGGWGGACYIPSFPGPTMRLGQRGRRRPGKGHCTQKPGAGRRVQETAELQEQGEPTPRALERRWTPLMIRPRATVTETIPRDEGEQQTRDAYRSRQRPASTFCSFGCSMPLELPASEVAPQHLGHPPLALAAGGVVGHVNRFTPPAGQPLVVQVVG